MTAKLAKEQLKNATVPNLVKMLPVSWNQN